MSTPAARRTIADERHALTHSDRETAAAAAAAADNDDSSLTFRSFSTRSVDIDSSGIK